MAQVQVQSLANFRQLPLRPSPHLFGQSLCAEKPNLGVPYPGLSATRVQNTPVKRGVVGGKKRHPFQQECRLLPNHRKGLSLLDSFRADPVEVRVNKGAVRGFYRLDEKSRDLESFHPHQGQGTGASRALVRRLEINGSEGAFHRGFECGFPVHDDLLAAFSPCFEMRGPKPISTKKFRKRR